MISIIINADTRPEQSDVVGMFEGTRSLDYLTAVPMMCRKFFNGFDVEVILFVDEHQSVPPYILDKIRPLVDKLVLSKHSKYYRGAEPFGPFNDVNYMMALSLCRGDIIAHFDQDTAAFTSSPDVIHGLIAMLEAVKFVSLPSACSPDPVDDASYGGKWWASTRFFMCKRESIDITALERAIRDPQWAYATHGRPPRENPWTEHLLTLIAGYSVFYPPIDIDRWAVFPWAKYKTGTLDKMLAMEYGAIAAALHQAGGLSYDGVDANLLNLP